MFIMITDYNNNGDNPILFWKHRFCIHRPESLLENEKQKFLWGFETKIEYPMHC